MFVHVGHDPRVFVILGVFAMGFGGYLTYRGLSAGPLTDVQAADLELGKPIPGSWLRVHGTARWDLGLHGDGDNSHRRFVPVVSPAWAPPRPVAVFLEILDRDGEPDHATVRDSASGIRVVGRGIPKDVITRFPMRGVHPTRDAFLMTANRTPRDVEREGLIWFACGVGGVLLYRLLPKSWKTPLWRHH